MEEGMSQRATSGDTHVAAVWGHTALPNGSRQSFRQKFSTRVADESLGQALTASFRLQALDESLFVARPGEDQSFPAVFQRDQPHRRIREKRQQFGVGEALDG